MGFDFVTGQITVAGNAASLTTDNTIRCERIYITNPDAAVVYIGKAGVSGTNGFGIDNTNGPFVLEYSGLVSDIHCVLAGGVSGSQNIHWLAIK